MHSNRNSQICNRKSLYAFGQVIYTHNGTTTMADYFPLGASGFNFAKRQASGARFVHSNALGSVGVVTDYAGATQQDEIYYPWGGRWSVVGSVSTERFASLQERDAETTTWQDPLDPTPNRLYTSGLGRWLSPDPLGGDVTNPQSLNRYAYVLNNPTNFTDPLGLQCGDRKCAESMASTYQSFHFTSAPPFGLMGGGGQCTIDGAPGPCSMALGLVAGGAASFCPNNTCTGVNEIGLPVEYNANGYYTCLAPGEYSSTEGAGKAAVGCTNGASVALNTEFSGNVYQEANGKYSFTRAREGTAASSPFNLTAIPSGTLAVGHYHTHGAYDPAYDNERFSTPTPTRPNDTGLYSRNNVIGFVGTPSGRIEIFYPNTAGSLPLGCVLVGPAVPAGSPLPQSLAVPTCH